MLLFSRLQKCVCVQHSWDLKANKTWIDTKDPVDNSNASNYIQSLRLFGKIRHLLKHMITSRKIGIYQNKPEFTTINNYVLERYNLTSRYFLRYPTLSK